MPGHRDPGGFDLPVRHVRVLDGLDAVLAEGHPGTALGHARAVRPVLLAVPGPAGDEHASALLARGRLAGLACVARGPGLAAAAVCPVRRPWSPAAPGGRRRRPVPAARALPGPQARRGCLALRPGLRGITAVDPDLHANPAEGGARFVEAVVDISAQRMQRHPALAVELRSRHLRAAEAARALDPDAPGAALDGGLHGLAHRPPERDPAGKLLSHALGNELRVDLWVLDLEYVQLDPATRELLKVAPDPVRLGAAPADDDARPCGVNPHLDLVLVLALNLDLGDAGPLHAALQHPADGDILGDVVFV